MAEVRKLVVEYLDEAKLMQIATAKDNMPWVASCWYVRDEKLDLYFISGKTRRHSLELNGNPNIAGAIIKPHVIGSGEKVRGLQFEGVASMCSGQQLELAYQLYTKKYPTTNIPSLDKLNDPNAGGAFYVIHPKMFVLFDEINFPENPRQELKL